MLSPRGMMCWQYRKCDRRERQTQSKLTKKVALEFWKGVTKRRVGFVLKSCFWNPHVLRILMLIAGGADITADARVLKSMSLFWWSLLSFFHGFVLHCLYLAQKANVCACTCKCGHPDIHWLSFVISGGYRNQKAVQNQLCQEVLTEVRDLKDLSCLQRVFKEVIWRLVWLQDSHFSVWTTELKHTISCVMEGYIYIYINVHIALQGYAKSWKWMGRNCYDQNTWIPWDYLE